MKTKLYPVFFLLIGTFQNAFSQDYVPLLKNSTWNYVSASFTSSQNVQILSVGDIVIGSFTYKKFKNPYGGEYFIREDEAARKVYRNVGGNDQLLFDFSLKVLDTIILGNGQKHVVKSITNINVEGGTRRKFYLDNGFSGEGWIEGVGGSGHPLIPNYEQFSDPHIYLTCSAQNGKTIFNYGIANGGTPTECGKLLAVEKAEYATSETFIYPNPITNKFSINGNVPFENATLKIFDYLGKLVKEMTGLNGQTLLLERDNLESGVYFIQLEENDKVMEVNKVVVAD